MKHGLLAMTAGALVAIATALPAQITSETEPNNVDSQANGPMGSGLTVQGTLSSQSDVDWFYFDVTQTGTITASLAHQQGGRRDFDVRLFRETGGAVATAATSQNPDVLTYSATSTGRYYLKVESYRGSGWYDLTATFPGADGDGDEGGGSDPVVDCNYGPRPSKPGSLRNYFTGNSSDACLAPMAGPGLLLMGGNFDIDEAFVLRAKPLVEGGDIVVLRTNQSSGYQSYLYNLLGANSVETLVIDSRAKANSDYVEWVIKSAEMVWIAGGDQAQYLNHWQGTKVDEAIRHVYDKGGVIGGISAGLAVLGEFIYDPDGIPGIYSSEAVTNPCHAYMNISTDFLNLPLMANIITDSHFYERDRMGRLATFMARIRTAGMAPTSTSVRGIGIDENTSLWIDKDGQAIVDGDYSVYVLREDAQTNRQQVTCGQPVIYRDILRTEMRVGETYNFTTNTTTGATMRIDIDGRYSSFYDPANPY